MAAHHRHTSVVAHWAAALCVACVTYSSPL